MIDMRAFGAVSVPRATVLSPARQAAINLSVVRLWANFMTHLVILNVRVDC